MGAIVGLDCDLAYNTGTHAAPVLVSISKAIDVELSMGANTATFASRESSWEAGRVALKTLSATFGYEYEASTDTTFDALFTAYDNKTIQEYYFMDGSVLLTGSEGIRAYCMITEFSWNQPLQDGVVVSASLQLARFEEGSVVIEPDWHTLDW